MSLVDLQARVDAMRTESATMFATIVELFNGSMDRMSAMSDAIMLAIHPPTVSRVIVENDYSDEDGGEEEDAPQTVGTSLDQPVAPVPQTFKLFVDGPSLHHPELTIRKFFDGQRTQDIALNRVMKNEHSPPECADKIRQVVVSFYTQFSAIINRIARGTAKDPAGALAHVFRAWHNNITKKSNNKDGFRKALGWIAAAFGRTDRHQIVVDPSDVELSLFALMKDAMLHGGANRWAQLMAEITPNVPDEDERVFVLCAYKVIMYIAYVSSKSASVELILLADEDVQPPAVEPSVVEGPAPDPDEDVQPPAAQPSVVKGPAPDPEGDGLDVSEDEQPPTVEMPGYTNITANDLVSMITQINSDTSAEDYANLVAQIESASSEQPVIAPAPPPSPVEQPTPLPEQSINPPEVAQPEPTVGATAAPNDVKWDEEMVYEGDPDAKPVVTDISPASTPKRKAEEESSEPAPKAQRIEVTDDDVRAIQDIEVQRLTADPTKFISVEDVFGLIDNVDDNKTDLAELAMSALEIPTSCSKFLYNAIVRTIKGALSELSTFLVYNMSKNASACPLDTQPVRYEDMSKIEPILAKLHEVHGYTVRKQCLFVLFVRAMAHTPKIKSPK